MAPVPRPPRPMKGAAGDLPRGEGWIYEVKWDGMRVIADVDPADRLVVLTSANGIDATDRFPELRGLAEHLPVAAVLDGEVVLVNEAGDADFGRLQHRMHLADPRQAERAAESDPIHFLVFDVLEVAGEAVVDAPWSERRRLLEHVLEPGPFWRVTDTHDDGDALLAVARDRHLEGLVAKQVTSTYNLGRRTRSWVKVKVRDQRELVVGGWTEGQQGRAGQIGALLLGHHVDGGLRYVGRVGTGWDDAELRRLLARLTPLETGDNPFDEPLPTAVHRTAHFTAPTVVVQVAIGSWTADRMIRHASYLGERGDVDPETVVDRP